MWWKGKKNSKLQAIICKMKLAIFFRTSPEIIMNGIFFKHMGEILDTYNFLEVFLCVELKSL